MRLRRLAVAVCLLPVVASALVACGGDDEGDLTPGNVIGSTVRLKGGDKSKLIVPTGEIKVRVGKPVDKLTGDQTRDLTAYDAPDGATFVPIQWRFDTKRFDGLEEFLATNATPVVDLVTGDHSYRLSPPKHTGDDESFFALVEGDAKKLSLKVRFDGVTQTADLRTGKRDPGPLARKLYRLDKKLKVESRSCKAPKFDFPRSGAQYDCDLTGPLLLPYAAGRWAEEGHRWLAVGLHGVFKRMAQASPKGAGKAGAWWFADKVTTTLRAGKRKPVDVLVSSGTDHLCPEDRTQECRYAAVAVFDVTDDIPKRLEVKHVYRLVLGPTWGDYDPRRGQKVTARGTIALKVD